MSDYSNCDQHRCKFFNKTKKYNCSSDNVLGDHTVNWCIGHPQSSRHQKVMCDCPNCKCRGNHRFSMIIGDKLLLVCDKCINTMFYNINTNKTEKVIPASHVDIIVY